MIQLYMSRRYVESSLKKGREKLDKIYYNLLLEYYYDLESDPRVEYETPGSLAQSLRLNPFLRYSLNFFQ